MTTETTETSTETSIETTETPVETTETSTETSTETQLNMGDKAESASHVMQEVYSGRLNTVDQELLNTAHALFSEELDIDADSFKFEVNGLDISGKKIKTLKHTIKFGKKEKLAPILAISKLWKEVALSGSPQNWLVEGRIKAHNMIATFEDGVEFLTSCSILFRGYGLDMKLSVDGDANIEYAQQQIKSAYDTAAHTTILDAKIVANPTRKIPQSDEDKAFEGELDDNREKITYFCQNGVIVKMEGDILLSKHLSIPELLYELGTLRRDQGYDISLKHTGLESRLRNNKKPTILITVADVDGELTAKVLDAIGSLRGTITAQLKEHLSHIKEDVLAHIKSQEQSDLLAGALTDLEFIGGTQITEWLKA